MDMKRQLAAGSGQRATNESLAFGVIRSLRSAVICCNGYKAAIGGRKSEVRGQNCGLRNW